MATDQAGEIFAINYAAIAREVAMDILPLAEILELHKLSTEEWLRISSHPKFVEMLNNLVQEWNSASNVRERVKIKAATGLEMQLETYITDIADPDIPLAQRVEAGKFLARLGELDGKEIIGGAGGNAFTINLNIGNVSRQAEVATKVIEGEVSRGAIPE